MIVTKKQIGQIHALLAKLGKANDKEFKRNLVLQYSNNKQTSTTKLYYGEAKEMIEGLQTTLGATPDQMSADAQRKKIIFMMHQMNWYNEHDKPDMERLNRWCVTSGMFHKALMEHDLIELPALVTQFTKVYKSYLKGIVK